MATDKNRRGTVPGLKTRDSQIQFIRLNGVRIAACAWNGHKEKGRGLVCVLSDLENEVLQRVPIGFHAGERCIKVNQALVRHEGIPDGRRV